MLDQLILDAICASMLENPTDIAPYSDAIPILERQFGVDRRVEQAYNRWMRERAKALVASLAIERRFAECDIVLQSIEAMLIIDSQTDFDAYCQRMEWRRDPSKRFYQPRRQVFYQVVQDLQDFFDNKLDFYSLSTPPRVGKSTIGCFFMSFCMGNHPLDAHLMSGFSDKLTLSFWNEMMSLITDDETYCFFEIFPESPLKDKNAANETISLAKKRRFPTLTCRSVGGTLTGAVEVGKKGVLYCDDMVEDYEQALNGDRMDKLYEAYLNQLRDRKLDGAKEFHIGTRWVPNDIIGRIEDEFGGNPRYRFRRIPALNEAGESNFVFQYGLGFSAGYYEEMRRMLVNAGSEDSWSAKYMCTPYWKAGRLFEADELNWFEELPDEEPDIIMAVCDTKTKGPDYCVMPIVYVYGDKHYVADVVCSDEAMDAIEQRLVDKLAFHNVHTVRFESNVAGGKIAQDVEAKLRLRGCATEVRTKYSTENKETRIQADSGWVKKKCLFRAKSVGEYQVFLEQLMSYTTKGKNRHDDVPDAMSMYRRFVDSTLGAKVTAIARPW